MMIGLFVIWSIAFTAIKHLREIFGPMELVLARFLPVLVLGVICLMSRRPIRKETFDTIREAPLKLIGMGLFGVTGYNYFIYLGQSEIKPGAAALVTTLAPLFTLILAILFLKEKVVARRIAGMLIAFAGLLIVLRWGKVGMGRITGMENADVKYMLLATLAPLSWSFYTIIGKGLLSKRSPAVVTCLPVVIGTLPLLFLATPDFFAKTALMEPSHWFALGYLSLASTLLGFFIWNLALRHMPASSVASFIYLNPPFAAFFGWLLFGEEVTLWFLAGSTVVIAGLYIAQRKTERRALS
jgi:drug/metabolite transporter (DMT)-like permease